MVSKEERGDSNMKGPIAIDVLEKGTTVDRFGLVGFMGYQPL